MICVGISGCSGGGGSSGELGAGGGGGITPPTDLPITGSARYDGFLNLGLPTASGRETITGNLGLDVDFDAANIQVTGRASGFTDADNAAVTGNILITDGVIDRETNVAADYTFEGGISGALSGPDFRNIVVTGTILGDFNGVDADVLSGQVFGDVIGPQGEDIFNGSFSSTSN